jgi:sterol desaturase/sphingolipid hydroxylase (fatty acid hydroxylase superfamily)
MIPTSLPELAMQVLRLAIWLALLAAIFVPLERFCALHPRPFLRRGRLGDVGLFFLNGLLPAVLLALPLAALAQASAALIPGGWRAMLMELPFWARLGLALLVAEIGAYWGHRASHAVPLLWRFHRVHHAEEQVDWLTNTHAHPVDLVFVRLCGLAAVYAVGLGQAASGAPDLVPLLVTLFGVLWGFFVHANLRWRFGPLEHLVATPAFHHWHHTRHEHVDRNFAALFPFVDRAFGTLHLPREWPREYGVQDAPPQTREAKPREA